MAEASDYKPSFAPLDELTLEGNGFVNPRRALDKSDLKLFAADIAERGLTTPLVVWTKDEEGKPIKDESGKPLLVILSGKRRFTALQLLVEEKKANGYKEAVPFRPFAGSLLEAQMEALSENIQRSDLSDFDQAEYIAKLVESGAKQQTLAQKLRKSPAWVSRILRMYKHTTPEVHKAWSRGGLTKETLDFMAENMVVEETVVDESGKKQTVVVPDAKAQEKELTRALAAKQSNSRAEKGKHRRKPQSKKADKRLSTVALEDYLKKLETTKKDKGYLHGMADALRLAAGKLKEDQLAPPYRQLLKELDKAERAAAAAAAKEAGETDDQ